MARFRITFDVTVDKDISCEEAKKYLEGLAERDRSVEGSVNNIEVVKVGEDKQER